MARGGISGTEILVGGVVVAGTAGLVYLATRMTPSPPPPPPGGGPPTPTGLAAAPTTTGAVLTCHASTGATSYIFHVDGVAHSSPTPTFTVTGQTAGTVHRVTVAAKNASGTSPASTAIHYTVA